MSSDIITVCAKISPCLNGFIVTELTMGIFFLEGSEEKKGAGGFPYIRICACDKNFFPFFSPQLLWELRAKA